MRPTYGATLLAALLVCLSPAALAGGLEVEVSRWTPDLELDARVDTGTQAGTLFSLENDLGVDGEEDLEGLQVLIDLGRRDRHHLFFSYAAAEYAGSRMLTRTITVDDTTYQIGETVGLDMDYRVGRLYYGFSFVSRERVQFGFQTGFFLLDTEGTLTASVSGPESFDLTAPFPVVGLHLLLGSQGRHRLRFLVTAVSLEVGDVDGEVVEAEAQYQFFWLPWLGVGAGLRSFSLEADVEDDGRLDLDQEGAFVGVTFRW